jgi:hypothetical protein
VAKVRAHETNAVQVNSAHARGYSWHQKEKGYFKVEITLRISAQNAQAQSQVLFVELDHTEASLFQNSQGK